MNFREFIDKYEVIPDAEWGIIAKYLSHKKYHKNSIILEAGEVCNYFYFLEKGIVRFFLNDDGNEITKFFTAAPFCFTAQHSFKNRVPAGDSIQALDELEVWRISWEAVDKIAYLKHWSIFTRKFVQEVQFYTEELLIETKSLSAENRYIRLTEKHPEIINRIPLKYLASFLGIAPQSLSRIRNKFQN